MWFLPPAWATSSAAWFEDTLREYGLLAKAATDMQLRLSVYRGVAAKDIDEAVRVFHRFAGDNNREFAC